MSSEGTSTQKGIVKLLYLEIVRKDEYKQWLEDPSYVGEALAKQRKPGDVPAEFERRFDISHLNHNLAAWQARLPQLSAPLYSYADVSVMVEQSPSRVFEYFLDELKWECEYSVKVRESANGNTRKTLVIHLPNDGYFYINGVQMEEFLGKVKKANVPNNRHRNPCHQGWSLLEKNVWEKIRPFDTFMVSWFGENYTPERMEKTIMYHADANRVDICLRHMDRHVGIEFSFEHSYPVALDDDWWDQF
jgi:hypothetical protein